jgi:hypothetical protein
MRQFYGALAALGVDTDTRWLIMGRIALDCAPAVRVALMRQLLRDGGWLKTSEIAEAAGMVTKTVARHLEDLLLLRLAQRTKKKPHPADDPGGEGDEPADNAPYYWRATDWLDDHWPPEPK